MTRITEEAVEEAAKAIYEYDVQPGDWVWSKVRTDEKRIARGRAALEAALPHLEEATPYELESERIAWHRKEGYEAGLGAQVAAPAPNRDAVVEALWNVRGMGPNPHRDHGYDAFCPVCMSNPYRIADALVAAGLIGGVS